MYDKYVHESKRENTKPTRRSAVHHHGGRTDHHLDDEEALLNGTIPMRR